MAELVSVIIPCYNVAPYLKECLDSVLAQTYEPLEIVCVDNNSSDNTKEVLDQLRDSHNLIIDEEKNPGACAARNKGLAVCKGEWVQFLDADDLLLADKIETQINAINNY